jgi:hypothetical protein
MVPIIGQIIAKQGAYNRKYKVMRITHLPKDESGYQQWVIELQPLGSFYQDGRKIPARKGTPSREVLVWGYDTKPYLNYYVADSGNVYQP